MLPFLRRLLNRIRYRRFDEDLAEEMAWHRDMVALETEDAHRAARRMGLDLRMRERAREVWLPPGLEALSQDVRDAVRMTVRRPLVTVMSVSALVVGVGAATLAFLLINALMLRPLPVERPDQLVYLRDPSFSYPIVREVQAGAAPLFTSVFAWELTQYDVAWGRDPEPSLVMLASGTLHETLGIRPLHGRLLQARDEAASAADAQSVGVLGHAAWRRRFGADPGVVGRVVRVQGVPITIVGVTPPGFDGVASGRVPELTLPVTLAPRLRSDERDILSEPARAWLHVMARLPEGKRAQDVDPAFQVVWSRVLEATTPHDLPRDRRAHFLSRQTSLVPGATGFSSVRNRFREPLLIVAGLAALLLLVACATVGTMLLAGAYGRSRELAVRLALGCSRARLARQLVLEVVVLAALAAAVSLVLAPWSGSALVTLLSTTLDPVGLDLSLDWRVGLFAAGVIAATAAIVSPAPIVLAMRMNPGPALRAGSRELTSQGRGLGRALVAAQIAVSVTLLVGAALFLRSLTHLLWLDPGFDSARLLVARIDPSQIPGLAERTDDGARLDAVYTTLLDRVARQPGVISASLSLYPPLSDEDGSWTQRVGVDGAEASDSAERTFFNAISPGHFATLGTRLVAGRDFTWADEPGADRVVIVNETLAARIFAGESPLGRRLTVGRNPGRQNLTIVGVVQDTKYQRLQEGTRAIAYLPYHQQRVHADGRTMFAIARVAVVSEAALSSLQDAIAEAVPGLTPRVERATTRLRESLVKERLLALLATVLAASALFLACAGIFGLMAHWVARRTREIGLRLALGAGPAAVFSQVLRQTLTLAGLGVVLGLTLGLAGGRWIRSVLHGVTPTDPVALVSVAAATLVLALAAGFVPARRAAAVDPAEALKME